MLVAVGVAIAPVPYSCPKEKNKNKIFYYTLRVAILKETFSQIAESRLK